MKKFTNLILLMIFMSSMVLFGQTSVNSTNSNEEAQMMKHRRQLSPNAQTQAVPSQRLDAKGSTTFTVQGDGSRALTNINIKLTVDTWYDEASYNLWSYADNAYYWGTDQTFSSAGQIVNRLLTLTEGNWYSVDCFDSYGDGGVSGLITNNTTGWFITSWMGTDYGAYGYFDFEAWDGYPPPVYLPITTFPFLADFESGVLSGNQYVEPFTNTYSGAYLSTAAASSSSYGFLMEGGSTGIGWTGGSTSTTYANAFTNNVTHQSQLLMEVHPTPADPNNLFMTFDFRQNYSFGWSYEWFRVLVDGVPIADLNGKTYWNPSTISGDAWQTLTFDLNAFKTLASFEITLQNSGKYYYQYSGGGDVAMIDNIELFYVGDPGIVINNPALNMGDRPIDAWMKTARFEIVNNPVAGDFSITDAEIDVNFGGFLVVETPPLPFTLVQGGVTYAFGIGTTDAAVTDGAFAGNFALIYGTRGLSHATYSGNAYTPVAGDVWELAFNGNTAAYPVTVPVGTFRDNYELPGTGDDGWDVVYKFVFTTDINFNAALTATDAKLALYANGFEGVGGPDMDNELFAGTTALAAELPAGTYYMAVSTTGASYTLGVTFPNMPLPDAATYVSPFDGATGVVNGDDLVWTFGANTVDYQVILGTTYPPTTVVVPWTDDLAELYELVSTQPNLQYFWQVNTGNSTGTTNGDIWGFTAALTPPSGLEVTLNDLGTSSTTVSTSLVWDAPVSRAFLGYNVYRNGTKLNTTLLNVVSYSDLNLPRNASYTYWVTAVYDQGESNPSNIKTVTALGVGTFTGVVTDVLTTDPIENASVVISGDYNYFLTTNADGEYSTLAYAGTYNFMVTAEGYDAGIANNVVLAHGATVTRDFALLESPYPVGYVLAEELNADEVQITWGGAIPPDPFNEWIYHDDGVYAGGLRYTSGAAMTVASRWTPDLLADYAGYYLSRISIYIAPTTPATADIELHVWTGTTLANTTLIYTQPIAGNIVPGAWNQFMLSTPILISDAQDLLFGYTCSNYNIVNTACSWDAGPAVYELGDLLWYGGVFVSVVDLSATFEHNWNLQGFVTNFVTGDSRPLMALENSIFYDVMRKSSALTLEMEASESSSPGALPLYLVDNTRAIESYDIYRSKVYQPETAEYIGNTTQQIFVDYAWDVQDWGVYQWSVVVNYTTQQSDPAYSNPLDKDMEIMVSATVTTDAGDSPAGTTVTFTNTSELDEGGDPIYIFEATLGDAGFADWADFRRGTYDIAVVLPGFTPIDLTGVDIFEDEDFVWMLEEILAKPGDLYVTPTGWATWTGAGGGGGGFTPYTENFDAGLPATWTVENGSFSTVTWENVATYDGGSLDGTPFMLVDSDGNMGEYIQATLISPVIEGTENATALYLEWDQNFQWVSGGDWGSVQVFDGTDWVEVLFLQTDDPYWPASVHHSIDVTQYANPDFQVKFYYDDDDYWAWYWAIDNFAVTDAADNGRNGKPGRAFAAYKVFLDGALIIDDLRDTEYQYGTTGEVLVAGETYTAGVAGVYTMGQSATAEFDFIYIPCEDYDTPTAFTAAQDEGTLNITLNWTNVDAAALDTIAGVNVYRDGELYGFIDFAGGIVNTYTDGPLDFGTYSYCITYVYNSGAETCHGVVCADGVEINGNAAVDGTVLQEAYLGGEPIEGAEVYLVSVDDPDMDFTFYADATGAYGGEILAGTYDYVVSALGYITETLEDVEVPLNATVTNDFMLDEFPLPPNHVVATEITDDEVLITWGTPILPFVPVLYDFETGPDDWDIQGNVNGWEWGNSASLSSSFMSFAGNSTNFIAVNADAAGSGGSSIVVNTTSPLQQFQAADAVFVDFDYILQGTYGDALAVYYSIDGATPVLITNLASSTSWTNYMVEVPAAALVSNVQIIFKYTESGTWGYGAGVDNVAITDARTRSNKPVLTSIPTPTRDMTGYEIYRTTCQTGDLQFMGMLPATDLAFTDHTWGAADPNIYKWGVVAVYETNNSEIAFSNCLDKDMTTEVSVTVLTNTGDSPAGTLVQFTNVSEPGAPVFMTILDDTGYYLWEDFRRGDYDILVDRFGFTPIEIFAEPIWEATDFVWLLEEEVVPVGDLHVNPNGFATWTGTPGPPPPPPPIPVVFEDNFDAYTAGGQLACQNPVDWTTWSNLPCDATEDAYVSDAYAYSGSNSAVIVQNNDLVKNLDTYLTSGAYSTRMMIYIPTGFDGYFNAMSDFDGAYEWGFEVYFDLAGGGRAFGGSATAVAFTYPHDTWMMAQLDIDLDNDWAEFYLDGTLIHGWQWTLGASGTGALLQLAAFDFFGATANTQMYFDDFIIEGPEDVTAARALEYYKVWLDGIFTDNTTDLFYQYDVTTLVPGQEYYSEVAALYTSGMSERMNYTWTYMPCDSFPGPASLTGNVIDEVDVLLTWSGTPAPPPPPPIVIIDEDFDNYTAGDFVAVVSPYFTTWSNSPGSAEDGHVSDLYASSLPNSAEVILNNDLVLIMDDYTTGVYTYEMKMYVPTGYCGYFNLQKTSTPGQEWAFQMYYQTDGTALGDAGAAGAINHTFNHDEWMDLKVVVDLNNDWATYYFNDVEIYGYQWTLGTFGTPGLLSFGGANIFGGANSTTTDTPLFYFDDVVLSKPADVRLSGVSAMSTSVGLNAEADANASPRVVENSRALWDTQFSFDIDGPSGLVGLAGAESDGEFIYATKWSASSDIVKFTVDGTYVETFQIPGVSSVRDLAFDGTYMYGAAASTTVYQMDFTNKTLISSFTAPTAVRAIAYDEDNDAFWGNNFSTDLVLFDRSGATLNTITAPPSLYGAAYDNFTVGGPFLWIFTGTSTGGGCQIEQIDIATGNVTGVSHSVSGDFGAYIAGGLYITEDLVTGKRTIGGTAQGTPDLAFGYELGDTGGGGGGGFDPGPIIGANVYRDGVLIAEMVQDTFYLDLALNYGLYEYCVNLVYEELAESCTGSCIDVEVTEDCAAPEDLTAELEGTNLVHLLWDQYVPPSGEWLSYNDGSFENGLCSTAGGAGLAQVFTPSEYPVTVSEVRYYNDAYGAPAQENEVYVLTGDGATVLSGPFSVIGEPGDAWVTVDIDDVTLTSGTFMVYTANVLPNGPFVGVDDSFYDGSLFFGSPGAFTELGVYGYYYVGSHEAYVTYGVSANVAANSILLSPASGGTGIELAVSNHASGEVVRPADPSRSWIGYNIYKDGDLLEALWPDNFYDYTETQTGEICYTVTAEYSYCGESDPSNEACVDIPVGIDGIGGENVISLYPNPATDLVNVTSTQKMNRLTVINYVGQVVYNEDVHGSTRVELNTGSFKTGVYLVKIETENGVVNKRVVIKK